MPEHRSSAAMVWPIAQMSSRSPSTVSSAVRRIAAGLTTCAAPGELAHRQIMLLEHPLHRLQIEFRRQVHHRAVFVVELPMRFGAAHHRRRPGRGTGQMRVDMPVEVHR